MRTKEIAEVGVIVNDVQAINRLKELTVRSEELRAKMDQLRKANDKSGFDKAAKELKAVQKESKQLKENVIDVNRVMRDLNHTSFNELVKTQRKLTREMKESTDKSSASYKKLKENVKLLNTEIGIQKNEMRDSVPILERASNAFNNYSGLIMAAAAAITAFVLGLREVANQIINFEKGFTNVKTLLSKNDLNEYATKLEQGAIQALKDYGFAVDDINKSLFDTISAGVPAATAIDVVNKSSKLAIGGVTDLSTATDGMTTVINAWKLSTTEAEQVASAFFSAQKAGKTTVSELALNIGKVAPVMAQANISYQEGLSLLAELTKGGISTAESTTYLKSAISSLINPSAEGEKVLRKLGVPLGISEIRAKGFTYTLQKLNEAMQKQPDVMGKAIGSVEAYTAIAALSGDALTDYQAILKQVNTDFGEGSSLANAYAMQQETTDQAMKRASASVKAMALELKENLSPALKSLFSIVSDFSHLTVKFFSWLNKNKETVSAYAKALALLLSYLIAYNSALKVTELWSKLVSAATWIWRSATLATAAAKALLTGNITRANAAMKMLNVTMKANPIGLLLGLISAAASAWLLYRDNVAEATEAEKKFNEIKEQTNKLLESSQSVIEQAKGMAAMNARQLENLRMRAEQELQVYEDLNVQKEALLVKYNQAVATENERARKLARNEQEYTALLNNQYFREQSKALIQQLSLLGESQSKFDKNELIRIAQTAKIKADALNKIDEDEAKRKEAAAKKAAAALAAASKKDPRIEALKKLIADTKRLNDDLELSRLSTNERELEEIRRKYQAQIDIAIEGEKKKDALAAKFAAERADLEEMLAYELAAKKQEQDERFEKAKLDARKKLGLLTLEEQQAEELAAIESDYNLKLISFEEYEQAKANITAKYAEIQKQIDAKALDERLQKYRDTIAQQQAATEAFGSLFSALKSAELAAAGDNEEKKKQIAKRYALPELVIAGSQIVANTAEAIMKAYAASPLTFGMPWSAIIGVAGAAQLAAVGIEKAKVAGLEHGGRFNVRRAQDNKDFYASFSGARRGYFNRPTVLVGEYNKPEYVISSTALANPAIRAVTDYIERARIAGQLRQIDYTGINNALHIAPGYASGGYTAYSPGSPGSGGGASGSAANAELQQLSSAMLAYMAKVDAWQASFQVVNNARETMLEYEKYLAVKNRASGN